MSRGSLRPRVQLAPTSSCVPGLRPSGHTSVPSGGHPRSGPDQRVYLLTLKCQCSTGNGAPSSRRQSGGFDKGRWPVRWPGDRAGFWPARISPIWAIARVPLSNPSRRRTFGFHCGPRKYLCFRASRPALVGRSGSVSGSVGQGAEAAARAARRAALKPYRKFSHGRRRSQASDGRQDWWLTEEYRMRQDQQARLMFDTACLGQVWMVRI